MNRWSRRGLWAVVTLIVLAGIAVFAATQNADRKMNRRIDVPAVAVPLSTDPAVLERGRYLFASRGCIDCHGASGAGATFIDDGKGMKVAGPNISPGTGNVVSTYRPIDWERTLRHGVKPDGRPLMIMPSEDYNRLTDTDIGAIASYVRSLPPVAGRAAVLDLPVPVRALYGFGMIQDAAAKIDHSLPPAAPVAEGVTVEHGKYVAAACIGCHGPQLLGGKVPGGPPDWPASPRLRPGYKSALQQYPDAESMLRMFKSGGKRADGTAIRVMPFTMLSAISDTDVKAMHLYLKSLPATP